jgi:hypothetical protein
MPDQAITGLANGGFGKFPLKCLQLLKTHDVRVFSEPAQELIGKH